MRAAASSTARGSPSRRRLSSATASALAGDSSKSRPRPEHAPRTIGWRAPPSGWRRSRTHDPRRAPAGPHLDHLLPAQLEGLRLVARTVSLGSPASKASSLRRPPAAVPGCRPPARQTAPRGTSSALQANAAPAARHPHHPGDRRDHQGRIGERRQIDEPDAIGEALATCAARPAPDESCRRHRGRSASAGARRPGRGGCGEGQLVLAPDQSRRLRREMNGDAGRARGRHGDPSVARRAAF